MGYKSLKNAIKQRFTLCFRRLKQAWKQPKISPTDSCPDGLFFAQKQALF
jgi:hypothetical protein